MNNCIKNIYTIGYASYSLETFVQTLHKFQITAVVDVRSTPYSKFSPDFNRETLKNYLKSHNIAYVFIGDTCGARVDDISCYVDKKVDFNLVAKSQKFNDGLDRIKKGSNSYTLAIMCAEKDPITCHRTILICRNLLSPEYNIKHILGNGTIEEHKDSEQRLLKLFNLHHPDMFYSEEQRLEEAYNRQAMKIAYEETETIYE